MAGRPGIGGLAVAALAALASAAAAQGGPATEPPSRQAANGALVAMPEISGLDCFNMARVLWRIDLTGYRDGRIVPQGHPDRPIFEYEDELARAYYTGCLVNHRTLDDPGAVFRYGFRRQ